MSSELAVGQKVVCINDIPMPQSLWDGDLELPVRGRIYTVRKVIRHLRALGADEDSLLLEEIVNPPREKQTVVGPYVHELSFRVSRFRPAPNIGIFKRMLEQAEPSYDQLFEQLVKTKLPIAP
jgi:hypothetical protein